MEFEDEQAKPGRQVAPGRLPAPVTLFLIALFLVGMGLLTWFGLKVLY